MRAGYIPQDEQPVYQSKGALVNNSVLASLFFLRLSKRGHRLDEILYLQFKQNVPKCPGLDEAGKHGLNKPFMPDAGMSKFPHR